MRLYSFGLRLTLALLLLCGLSVALAIVLGQLAPARPKIYLLSWQPGTPFFIVALDVDQNFSVRFAPQPQLPSAAVSGWLLSPDGKQFLIKNAFDLMTMNNRGRNQQWVTADGASSDGPSWSPDGSRIAFASERDSTREIYVMNADGSNEQRLTFDNAYDSRSSWSPDGLHLAFLSYRDGKADISIVNPDGTDHKRLTVNDVDDTSPTWSPDGQHIAFVSFRDGDAEIFVMDSDGNNQRQLTSNETIDQFPDWSPNENRIIFSSDREGMKQQLYIMDADGSNQHLLVSTDGVLLSNWSPDGHHILLQTRGDDFGKTYIVNADGSNLRFVTNWNVLTLWLMP